MVARLLGRRIAAGIAASIVLSSLPLSAMATTVGPVYPTVGANLSDAGITAWSNPGNIVANDSSFATFSTGGNSQYLRARDFNFAIPSDATITGIQVTVGRRATQVGGPGTRDIEVNLYKGGTGVVGSNYADTVTDWPTTITAANYGSNTDMWGTTWTPAQINASGFGVVLRALRNGETADVDYIRVRVSYTDAQMINVTTSAPSSSEYGSTFPVAATATSGLTVDISVTGGCSYAAGTVTMTSGTTDCHVHYNQAGNTNYSVAAQVTQDVTATKKPLTITASNQMKTFGTTFTFTGSEFGYSALVGSDTVTSATITSAGAPAGASVAGSPYAIQASAAMGTGLGNYIISYDDGVFTVNQASQTINVGMSAPGSATNGSNFNVAATATSGLTVVVTTTGGCTNAGNTVTMTSDSVTCVVHYNQAGDTDYSAAMEVTENVTAMPAPPVSTCDTTLNPGDSIQNAINAASSGDEICLNPGTYTIAAAININKSVTLTKTGCDPNVLVARTAGSVDEAIINGNNAVGNAILISTSNVTVSCLEVKNTTGDAVTSVNSNPQKTGVVVKNNLVHNAGDEGIQLKRTNGAIIQYNEVYSTTGDGINISENTANGQIIDNKVHNSTSTDGAIYVYDSLNTTIQGNLLYNVSTNDAIKLGNKNGADIANAGGVIAENVIVTGSQDAISIYMSNVEVYGNKLKNSTSAQGAIYVRGGNNTINIHDNLIVDNNTTGVKVGGAAIPTNVLVNDNCIEGNNAGLTLIAGSAMLNAEGNWWGAPSGPSGAGSGTGDTVAANVDYTPFNTTGCGLAPIVDLNNDGIPDGSDDPLAVGPFSTTTSLSSDLNPSVYGDTVTFTATVTGTTPTGTVSFYSGATLLGTDSLDGSFQATLSIATLNAGSNDIEAVYAGDMNNVTSTSSTVVQVVTQKAITVTPDAGQTKVYGDSDMTLTYTNDALSFSDTFTGDLSRVAGEDVGTYNITIGTLSAGPNYALTLDAETFEITQKTINVTPDAGQTKVYGDSDMTLTYTNDALSFSDSFTGDLARVAGENVGTYNITIGTLDAGTNYILVLGSETFEITQKGITVTPDAGQTKVYGDADMAFTYTHDPLSFSDTMTGSLARVAGENVGTYAFTIGTLTAGSNYSLTLDAETYEITQKTINVTPDASQSKVYGDADPVLTYTNDMLSFSDTFSGALSRDAGENVGDYNITIGTLDAGTNYVLVLGAETFAITQLATVSSTVLDTPTPSSLVGSGVILKATVTGVNPTGTVEFYSGSLLVGSSTLLGDTSISNGSGSITHTFTYAGSYTLTAKYLGDANHLGSFSADPLTVHVVDKDDADTVTTMSSSGSSLVGSGVTLTATVAGAYNPTGTVEFYDSVTLIGSSSLNGSFEATLSWTFTTAGNHDLTSHYLGDANNNASVSMVEPIFVQEVRKDSADTVTTMSTSGSSLVGVSVDLTATVTGAYNPTGTVEFYDGASLIGSASLDGSFQATIGYVFPAAGLHNITSHYLGDSNNNASVSGVELIFVQEVRKDTPDTVTTISSSGSSLVGVSVDLTATVAGAYNPTGTVEFYDGAVLIGTGSLNGSFEATLSHTFTLAGNHDIVAHYLGDANNNASYSAIEPILVQEVRKDSPVTQTVLSVANPSTIGDMLTFTADVTGGYNPTGIVVFKDGGVMIGTGALVGGTATFMTDQLAVGSHDITAEYEGDVNNNPSVSAVVTVQIVQKKTSVTILADLPTELDGPAPLTFNVTVNGYFPTGTVAIWDGSSFLLNVTLVNGEGSFTQIFAGTEFAHTYRAEYPGDVNNTASVSAEKTVTIHAGNGSDQEQGAASNRGSNLMRAMSIVRFAANLHLGDLPPGSFGGDDAPLAGAEKEYLCSIQRSLPANFKSSYVNALAQIMSTFTGRDVEEIAAWLRDPSVCGDITVSRSGIEVIAQAVLKPFYVSSQGFPLSENPTWNKCVTGKFTYEDIQANPDRDRKNTPKSCADYHTGSSWYHPTLNLFFDWNLGTKKLTVPAGYVIVKDEAVTVR